MATVNTPTPAELIELTDHRDAASVSIYLQSSPLPSESQAVRLALRNLISGAEAQLRRNGIDNRTIADLIANLRSLDDDGAFWRYQAHSICILAAPGVLHVYRIANTVKEQLFVSDRFEIGSLLRAVTFPNLGYVVAVGERTAKLFGVGSDHRATELELEGLPDDLHSVFEKADNEGRADRDRATGATGDRIEHERYCRIVQDAVVARVSDPAVPLILVASDDFKAAYRAVNTHPGLLERGIESHPDSLTVSDVDERARTMLDEHYAAQLVDWRERFGTNRSNGLATSKLREVAFAATAAAVDELLFDMDSNIGGTIDDQGAVSLADDGAGGGYNLVDEIAARVLRSGGTVRAVRQSDLLDGSPVAATLRYPVSV